MGDLFLARAAVPLILLLLPSSPPPLEPAVAAARPSLAGVGRRYGSIFGFGDSYTDTGNCDGCLVIDFLAERLDLPLVPPFLAHGDDDGSLRRGANFAVGSATAIDASFFHHDGDPPGGSVFTINVSLGVQLHWFESLKPSRCATRKECQELFGSSFFLVGELGFNDYSFSLARSKSVQLARSLVPDVVSTISMAVEVITIQDRHHMLVDC